MMSSLRDGSLPPHLLQTALDIHRINYPDDGAIRRHLDRSKWKRRLPAPAPEDQLALPRPDRIDRNQRLARVRKFSIDRLNDQNLTALQRAVLDRTDDRTYDAGQVH